jgi:hypothetical protein
MKSFFAALRSLVLPYGATSGSRIVLDGVNGTITVYNSAGIAIGVIDGTFGIQVNGVNNGYIQTNVGIDPDTGLSQAQIIFRPSSTSWLPDADIDTGVIRVYGDSAGPSYRPGVSPRKSTLRHGNSGPARRTSSRQSSKCPRRHSAVA